MSAEHGREMAAAVKAHLPEAVPFIRDLHRCELIDGWRNVSYVGPDREQPGITVDRITISGDGAA